MLWYWPNPIIKISSKREVSLSYHINSCSLNKNFDYILYLWKDANKNCDIIAVSETKTSKKTPLTSNINLNNYSFESPPTEWTVDGRILYISNCLSYKPRIDLNIH